MLQTLTTPTESPILGVFPAFSVASGGRNPEAGLEGCLVFTRDGVYELVGNADPREMFLDMVSKV